MMMSESYGKTMCVYECVCVCVYRYILSPWSDIAINKLLIMK